MAKVTEINVSYSVGLKVNLGNYESADFHLSESHRLDVSNDTPGTETDLANAVREEIAQRLNDEVVARGLKAKEREF